MTVASKNVTLTLVVSITLKKKLPQKQLQPLEHLKFIGSVCVMMITARGGCWNGLYSRQVSPPNHTGTQLREPTAEAKHTAVVLFLQLV